MPTLRSPRRSLTAHSCCTVVGAFTLACTAYNVQQTSLVPVPTLPPPASPERRADLYTQIDAVSVGTSPSPAPNANTSLWVPREQVEGALSLRVAKRLTLRVPYVGALPGDAVPVGNAGLGNPGRAALGAGLGMAGRIPLFEDSLSLDVSLDTLEVWVPSIVQGRDRDGNVLYTESRTDATPLVNAGLAFNVRATDWLLFRGAMSAATHTMNYASRSDVTSDGGVYTGPFVAVLGASVEVRPWDWFALVGQLQWTASDYPVRYGPTVALGVRAPFGDVPGSRGRRARSRGPLPGEQPLEPMVIRVN